MAAQPRPLVKKPCHSCRERHLKCDEERPKCRRCVARGLDCVRVQRRVVFCQGSKANYDNRFPVEQSWVNSKPKNAQLRIRETRKYASKTVQAEDTDLQQVFDTPCPPSSVPRSPQTEPDHQPRNAGPAIGDSSAAKKASVAGPILGNEIFQESVPSSGQSISPTPVGLQVPIAPPPTGVEHHGVLSNASFHKGVGRSIDGSNSDVFRCSTPSVTTISQKPTTIFPVRPLKDIQEACLLRFWIEEISPWFDLCDEERHFQCLVPSRARNSPPLLNAILAVSSRHLSRLLQYKTPRGVEYHGFLLPDLTTSTPVEYMLQCIPALLGFHDIHDKEEQENIMAAAVILRQYEELEEDEIESDSDIHRNAGIHPHRQANFLAVTQAIIETTASSSIPGGLPSAIYWMAIRQEIYYSLTRERCLRIGLESGVSHGSSAANALIMHAGNVTKWRWGDKSEREWESLNMQQQHLADKYLGMFAPLLDRKADKSKGEIFPTVWYSSDAQMTGAQHFELARMIMIAENPNLENAPQYRSAHRKAEAQVRSIIFRLCGIALGHSKSRPALINAAISIMLYGEYFTDQSERRALVGIIDKLNSMHAWPMKKPYQVLKARWELTDNDDY